MLKPRQVKKLLLAALRPDAEFAYQGYARGIHYLRHKVPNGTDPKHNLAALTYDQQDDCCTLAFGTAFFEEPARLAVASAFSRWQSSVHRVTFGSSKQSAKKAVMELLKHLRTANFVTTYLLLKDDRPLRELFTFFESFSQQLSLPDTPARAQLKQRATPDICTQLIRLSELQTEWRDDEALDDYLESLGEEGDFQGSAAFTLNREDAVRKLADYQLGDPVLLPLFLALGLTLSGARHLALDVDSDETWVRFEGTDLPATFLEDIPSHLLATSSEPRGLALQALGRALLQGAAHSPAALQLDTPAGMVDLRDFPRTCATVEWSQPQSGTFYHKRRFDLNVARRYWRSRSAPHAEVPELLAALRLLPVPWTINGQSPTQFSGPQPRLCVLFRLPGQRLPDFGDTSNFVELESPLPATVLFRLHPEVPPSLTAILHHMVVEVPAQTTFQPTIETVIWLPEIATDLSGRKLVESQLLSELLRGLRDLEDKAWEVLLRRYPHFDTMFKEGWTGPFLKLAADGRFRPILERLVLLPRVAQEPICLGDWLNAQRHFHCAHASSTFAHPLLSGDPVVASQHVWTDDLGRLVPDLEDATARLRHTAYYHREREKWLAQPHVASTAPPDIPRSLQVKLPGGRGVIWVSPHRGPVRDLISQSRALPYKVPPKWAPPFMGFRVNAEGVGMDSDWRYPEPEDQLEALRKAIAYGVPDLAQAMAKSGQLGQQLAQLQLSYLLAFMKATGTSLKPWENVAFIPLRGQLRTLADEPDYLIRYLADL